LNAILRVVNEVQDVDSTPSNTVKSGYNNSVNLASMDIG
jgi:hypothetical protein